MGWDLAVPYVIREMGFAKFRFFGRLNPIPKINLYFLAVSIILIAQIPSHNITLCILSVKQAFCDA